MKEFEIDMKNIPECIKIFTPYKSDEKFIEKGEWDNEPSFLCFIDKKTDYFFTVNRNPVWGCFSANVLLPENHIYHGIYYKNIKNIKVHGGLTFSKLIIGSNEFWIGFDFGHAGDFSPGLNYPGQNKKNYRNLNYVINECLSVAKQLKNMES